MMTRKSNMEREIVVVMAANMASGIVKRKRKGTIIA